MKTLVLVILFSVCAPAFGSTVEVYAVNAQIASAALQDGLLFIQNGRVQRPDLLDDSQPYCHSDAFHFRLDSEKSYAVLKTDTAQIDGLDTWSFTVHLDPESHDPLARFTIPCFAQAPKVTSLQDVVEGLSGVYQVKSR